MRKRILALLALAGCTTHAEAEAQKGDTSYFALGLVATLGFGE